jgi:hypothetical protein
MSPRVSLNLGRMHKYGNLPLCKQLSFDFLTSFPFHRKEIFPWEHGNIENWGAGGASLGFVGPLFGMGGEGRGWKWQMWRSYECRYGFKVTQNWFKICWFLQKGNSKNWPRARSRWLPPPPHPCMWENKWLFYIGKAAMGSQLDEPLCRPNQGDGVVGWLRHFCAK